MLDENSQSYIRTNCAADGYYYYEAIQVNVAQSGYYNILSENDTSLYGNIYKDNFDPNNPYINEHFKNDDRCNKDALTFYTHFQSNTTYILIVTTQRSAKTGNFSVSIFGPNKATLKRISKYIFAVLTTIRLEIQTHKNVCKRCFNFRSTKKFMDPMILERVQKLPATEIHLKCQSKLVT